MDAETPPPYFPLDPQSKSSLLQSVPFLIETQRQITYRHVRRLQQIKRHGDAGKELERRIARDKARSDVEKLVQLLNGFQDSSANMRDTWRLVALGLFVALICVSSSFFPCLYAGTELRG